MTKLETEFLEEYKRTDNMIKDAYTTQNGVSSYIKLMEDMSGSVSSKVPSWNAEYKMLKHLRWLRNKIAHETGATELENSDLDDLIAFRRRFTKAQDALAQAEALKRASRAKKAPAKSAASGKKDQKLSNRKPFPWIRVIIGGLIAAIIYLIVSTGGSFN